MSNSEWGGRGGDSSVKDQSKTQKECSLSLPFNTAKPMVLHGSKTPRASGGGLFESTIW